jgi:Tol biopolymer transport system component
MEANPVPTRPRHRARRGALALLSGAVASTALVLATPQAASALPVPAFTSLVSRSDAGTVGTGTSHFPDLSGDGRFVAFQSTANNLVAGDTNGIADIFVRDRVAAKTERVSLTDADLQITGGTASFASISDDGRRVAFLSSSNQLIPGDDKGRTDAFVRDRLAGTTTRVVTGIGGALLDAGIVDVEISGNGRYVAFVTSATNVVSGDTNGETDIFVRDLQTGLVERVSVNSSEQEGSGWSYRPSISDDGRYVAFDTSSLLAGGAVGESNVYVRDRTAGTTSIVNVSSAEVVGDQGGQRAYISGNGRYVAFASDSTNLVAGDANGQSDAFRRDLVDGVTTRITWTDGDAILPLGGFPMGISDDGNQVAFRSSSPATGAADAGADADLFVRTVSTASTRRVSLSATVADPAIAVGDGPMGISDDGLQVAFGHTNKLVADATFDQIYVNGPMEISLFANLRQLGAQQIVDFLGRNPVGSEPATLEGRVLDGRAHPGSLIAELALGSEFAGKQPAVIRLYWAFFLRKPDLAGLNYWIGKYEGGMKLSAIAQKFAQSSEFKNRYGALSNGNYVKQVYLNVFERQPDASGLAYWTGKLDRKELIRGDVIVQFSESSEGVRRLAPQVAMVLIGTGMLEAMPSASLWDQGLAGFKAGEKQPAWFAYLVLRSGEYQNRFD